MTQLISNVLMQPKPTDAVEHLTLIEKLEKEKNNWHDDGENNVHRVIDDCIDIVKQHEAEARCKMTKTLTQDIFKGAPDWVRSAAVDENGVANYFSVASEHLLAGQTAKGGMWLFISNKLEHKFQRISDGYDTTDWQNSAIDREVKNDKPSD